MKVLIVYSHYDAQGNNGTALSIAQNILQKSDINFEITDTFSFFQDLYGKTPISETSTTQEWILKQRKTESYLNAIAVEQRKISEASALIFIHPNWFGSPPFSLSLWISEIFKSRSFKLQENNTITSLWTHLRTALILMSNGFGETVSVQSTAQILSKCPDNHIRPVSLAIHKICCNYNLITALSYAGISVADIKIELFFQAKHGEPAPNIQDWVATQLNAWIKTAKDLPTLTSTHCPLEATLNDNIPGDPASSTTPLFKTISDTNKTLRSSPTLSL